MSQKKRQMTESELRERMASKLEWLAIPDATWQAAVQAEYVREALDFGPTSYNALWEFLRRHARKKPGGRRGVHAAHPYLPYHYTKAMRERLIAEGRLEVWTLGDDRTPDGQPIAVDNLVGPPAIDVSCAGDIITILAEPWVPVETVRSIYLAAQSWIKGDDAPNRRCKPVFTTLYRWVTVRREQYPLERWQETMVAWNASHDRRYWSRANFHRDYQKAKKALAAT